MYFCRDRSISIKFVTCVATYSFAAKHMSVNSYGENVPALYTPTNQLSKTSALTVLFNKYCVSIGYVPPEPPKPQVSLLYIYYSLHRRFSTVTLASI